MRSKRRVAPAWPSDREVLALRVSIEKQRWYCHAVHRGFIDRIGTGLREVDLSRSIVAHLEILLNTRAGESVTVPDYGLQDLTDVVNELPEGIHTIQQGIRAVILKYEPRLSNVSVRHLPDDSAFALRFEVVARVKDSKRSLIRLQTAMQSDGRFAMD